MPITLEQINSASTADALHALDGVYEHSPWIAAQALAQRPFRTLAHLKHALAHAVRTATALPSLVDRSDFAEVLRDRARASWRRQRFYRMLGAMLFRAAEPDARYRIFERFYRLSPRLIARFYAGRSTTADKLRLLSGKPPVPIGRAIAALAKRDWL